MPLTNSSSGGQPTPRGNSSGLTYNGDVNAANKSAKQNNALWYAFQGIGRAYLVQRGTAAAGDADESGAHGYNTIQKALQNPNTVNPLSQVTITQWNDAASLPVGGGAIGVIETVDVTTTGNTKTVSTPQNPLTSGLSGMTGINAIGQFFSDLGNPQFWIRAGKIVGGLTLVIVGLIKLTGTDQRLGGAAAKAVKFTPFL